LYGPGENYHRDNSHVLPALIRRFYEAAEANAPRVSCWGTGAPLRESLHVDDLGEACVFAVERWQPGAEDPPFLNVGTGVDSPGSGPGQHGGRVSRAAQPTAGAALSWLLLG
jgi:GDP-L-fucose synthase